jgi:hypothetical protein
MAVFPQSANAIVGPPVVSVIAEPIKVNGESVMEITADVSNLDISNCVSIGGTICFRFHILFAGTKISNNKYSGIGCYYKLDGFSFHCEDS